MEEEIEYFRRGDTVVAGNRAEINGQAHALHNADAVKVVGPSTPILGILLTVIGVAMAATGSDDVRAFGLLLAVGAGARAWYRARLRSLVIVRGSGEVTCFRSTDAGAVEDLRAAIAEAISQPATPLSRP